MQTLLRGKDYIETPGLDRRKEAGATVLNVADDLKKRFALGKRKRIGCCRIRRCS